MLLYLAGFQHAIHLSLLTVTKAKSVFSQATCYLWISPTVISGHSGVTTSFQVEESLKISVTQGPCYALVHWRFIYAHTLTHNFSKHNGTIHVHKISHMGSPWSFMAQGWEQQKFTMKLQSVRWNCCFLKEINKTHRISSCFFLSGSFFLPSIFFFHHSTYFFT